MSISSQLISLVSFLAIFSISTLTQAEVECPPSFDKFNEMTDDGTVSWCQKDDVKDGPFERYFNTGEIQTQGEYKNNQASGEWKRYWANGQIRDIGRWENDKPIGKWKFYDQEGQLINAKNFSKITPSNVDRSGIRLRFGVLTITTPEPEGEKLTNPFLGADVHLWEIASWFHLRATFDIARPDVPQGGPPPQPPYHHEPVWTLLTLIGLEFVPPWFPNWSLMVRAGRLWLDFGDEDEAANGLELRYYFQKKPMRALDSVFLAGGSSGNKDDKNANEAKETLLGLSFTF